METKTVFLLQGMKEQNEMLANKFESTKEFKVCGMAEDGISAILMIEDKKPDILITELVLAGYDGLSVIDKIRALKLPIKIIVLTSLISEEAIQKAMTAGADYFLAKPINFNLLYERLLNVDQKQTHTVKEVSEPVHAMSVEEKVSRIFINVGIPPHIKGYNFLREGVLMAIEDPEIINNITKKLYPMIGEKYSTTASKVERAIRHAIEVAWNKGRIDSINSLFGVRVYSGNEKPTNGEFIALVADKMLLESV